MGFGSEVNDYFERELEKEFVQFINEENIENFLNEFQKLMEFPFHY
ncbi:MAG: hypothetical protein GY928_35335 [Colwellia sp.]|nr:hypothetical protein [Colwellia sp.]